MTKFCFTSISIAFLLSLSLITNAQRIKWFHNWNVAQDISKSENKLILIYFSGSDWCSKCKLLDNKIFNNNKFVDFAEKEFVLFNADYPMENKLSKPIQEQNEKLKDKYHIRGFPVIILTNFRGDTIFRTGYNVTMDENYYIKLFSAKNNSYKQYEEKMESSPSSFAYYKFRWGASIEAAKEIIRKNSSIYLRNIGTGDNGEKIIHIERDNKNIILFFKTNKLEQIKIEYNVMDDLEDQLCIIKNKLSSIYGYNKSFNEKQEEIKHSIETCPGYSLVYPIKLFYLKNKHFEMKIKCYYGDYSLLEDIKKRAKIDNDCDVKEIRSLINELNTEPNKLSIYLKFMHYTIKPISKKNSISVNISKLL